MNVAADPKPAPRVKDPSVYDEFHRWNPRCLACLDSGAQAAHLLRGAKREDVLAALIPLCHACHGAFDNAQRYWKPSGKYVTPTQVRGAVAAWLRFDPDALPQRLYLTARLGPEGSVAFLEKLER